MQSVVNFYRFVLKILNGNKIVTDRWNNRQNDRQNDGHNDGMTDNQNPVQPPFSKQGYKKAQFSLHAKLREPCVLKNC